jgi:PAS domain S-box-containing protein
MSVELDDRLAELQRREEQMRFVLNQAPVAIAHCTRDHRFQFVNRRYAARFGLSPEKVAGRPIVEVIGREAYEKISPYIERVLNGERVEYEIEVPFSKLGVRTMHCEYAPERNMHGEVEGWVAVVSDVTERKRAEASLRESEARLRNIFEHTSAGIAQVDRQGRFLHVNSRFCEITGRSADELRRTTCTAITHPGDRDCDVSMFERSLDDRRPYVIEKRYVRPDGSEVWVRNSVSGLKDASGRLTNMLAVSIDVTDRKRAEVALQESERRFARFMQNLPGLAWIKDLEGRYVYANDAAMAAFGKTPSVLYSSTDEELFSPESADSFRRNDAEAIANENGVQVIETLRHDDGLLHYSLVHKFPIFGVDDHPTHVGGVAIDVTERLRAEDEMRRSKERLELAQGAGRIGVFEWNIRTDEVEWSATEEELFGIPVGTFNGRLEGWIAALHPEDREQAVAACMKAVAMRAELNTEFRIVRPDGEIRWIAAQGRVFCDESGEPVRMVGVNLDVTERKDSEAALKEADRRKDEFLATLAHELRNPLAPIRNALQLIRQVGGEESIRNQATTMMERQVAQMVRLIDDLLDLSRITRNKLELRKEWVEFAVAVQSAVETARPLIESFGHTLTVSVPTEPILLHADLTRLAQVFSNLLTNAAKYTDRGGSISLVAELDGIELVARVRDNGVGIPADMLPHVFDMFVQVDRSLEKSQGGLGIGLTLVKRLIELHGGRVEANSSGPGRGSEFVVRLPILVNIAATSRRPSPSNGRTENKLDARILIADDNKDSAESLAMLLQLRGAEVRTVHDGLEAIETAKAFQPDLVLLDIGMPKLNGYDAARRLREQPWSGKATIVAMTGWGQPDDKRRAADAGFDHHLTKPIEPNVLDDVLTRLKSPRD